jgi:hypothetical protein
VWEEKGSFLTRLANFDPVVLFLEHLMHLSPTVECLLTFLEVMDSIFTGKTQAGCLDIILGLAHQ